MPFVVRPRFDWRLHTRTLALGEHTRIMGILNVTPDSFSDAGSFLHPRTAAEHAFAMLDEGADLIDLGGESTRPNAVPITSGEEQTRVLPVLQTVLAARPNAILSIDTYHSETARVAIESGAEIVNDVSGHLWDPAMSTTCASLLCGAILMHSRSRPQQWSALPALDPAAVVPLVLSELAALAASAQAAGIARESIVLDPGFGFGKRFDENYPLLSGFDQFHSLGFPLLAGVSRKSFLARTIATLGPALGTPNLASETWGSTTVANTAAMLAGAHILRVHDVRPARAAAEIADRILQTSSSIPDDPPNPRDS